MERSITIPPTYFAAVERALYRADGLDAYVEFSKCDPSYPLPVVTEVTVYDRYPEEIVQKVREVLTARFPVAK